MATTIGKLVVSLSTRTAKFQKGLSGAASNIKNFAVGIGRAAKTVALFGVVAAAAAAVGIFKLIKSASAFEEISGKFAAVFKELTPEAETFVNALSEELGRSRVELTSFMATLQDTFVPLGFARKEGLEMSKTLTRLTIDLASFNDKAEPDVLRDLQSAIVGNHETMRKYGVIITQTALSQELLNSGIKGGAKDATEAQKAAARLALILKGTTDAQGDALRTASGYANQVRRLKSQISDISVILGTAFLPIAKEVVASLSNMATWVKNQSPAIAAWIKDLIEGGKIIGEWFVSKLTAFIETGIFIFTFWETAIANWKDIVDFGVTKVLLMFVRLGAKLKHLFTEVIPANIKFLAQVLVDLATFFPKLFKSVFTNMLTNAKNFFKSMKNAILGKPTDFKFVNLLKGFEFVTAKIGLVAERVPSALEKSLEGNLATTGKKLGIVLGKGVADAAETRIAEFREFVTGLTPEIPKIAEPIKSAIASGGKEAAKSISDAMKGPGAIEKGTVEAFSATVNPTFRAMSDNAKSTVAELKEANRLQRESNRKLSAFAEGAVVVEFA